MHLIKWRHTMVCLVWSDHGECYGKICGFSSTRWCTDEVIASEVGGISSVSEVVTLLLIAIKKFHSPRWGACIVPCIRYMGVKNECSNYGGIRQFSVPSVVHERVVAYTENLFGVDQCGFRSNRCKYQVFLPKIWEILYKMQRSFYQKSKSISQWI